MQLLSFLSPSTCTVLLYGDASTQAYGHPRHESWEYATTSKKLRPRVIAHYGGMCVQCGSRKKLELDHIHNDGKKHRAQMKEANLMIEEWLIKEGFPENVVQVLCQDCHRRKTRGAHRLEQGRRGRQ